MRKSIAVLRVCASCEWIYKLETKTEIKNCPKCGFSSYSAYSVFGNKAYRIYLTQERWMNRALANISSILYSEIEKSRWNKCNSDHTKLML